MDKEFDADILDDADPEILEFVADNFEKNYDEEMMKRIFDMAEKKYHIRMEESCSSVIPDEPAARSFVSDNTRSVTGKTGIYSVQENIKLSEERSAGPENMSDIPYDMPDSAEDIKTGAFEKKYISAVLKTVSFAAALLLVAGAVKYGTGSLRRVTDNNETDPGSSVSDQFVQNDEGYSDIFKHEMIGRELKTAVNSQTASKDDIFDLMMNTIDYFNQASGRIYYGYSGGELFSSEFQCDMTAVASFSRYTVYSSETTGDLTVASESVPRFEYLYYGLDTSMICKDPERKLFKYDGMYSLQNEMDRDSSLEMSDSDVLRIRRGDTTNVVMSGNCLVPGCFALTFLKERELWNLTGTEVYNNRECYHISGENSEFIPDLGVVSFDMLVDAATGVMLRYEGYNTEHELMEFVYTENIRFDEEASPVRGIDQDILEGYSYAYADGGFEAEYVGWKGHNVPGMILKTDYYTDPESKHNIPGESIDFEKIYESIESDYLDNDYTEPESLLSLDELFSISDCAVECTVLNKKYNLINFKYPETDYTLRVEKSFSGYLHEGDLITLGESGGYMDIYDYLEYFPEYSELEKYKDMSKEERINNYVYLYSKVYPEFKTGEKIVAFINRQSDYSNTFSSVNNGTGIFRFKDKDKLERTDGSEHQEISYYDIIESAGNMKKNQ